MLTSDCGLERRRPANGTAARASAPAGWRSGSAVVGGDTAHFTLLLADLFFFDLFHHRINS